MGLSRELQQALVWPAPARPQWKRAERKRLKPALPPIKTVRKLSDLRADINARVAAVEKLIDAKAPKAATIAKIALKGRERYKAAEHQMVLDALSYLSDNEPGPNREGADIWQIRAWHKDL